MPLPLVAFVTVSDTANAFPATALATLSLLAFSFVDFGGAAVEARRRCAVIARVVETLAPESSVTVSLAVNVPAAGVGVAGLDGARSSAVAELPGVGGDRPVRVGRGRAVEVDRQRRPYRSPG